MKRALLALLLLAGCKSEHVLVKRPAAPPASVAFLNVDVLDVVTGSIAPNRNVLVKDGKIASIVPGTEKVEAAKTIDGRGHTLLPGLIDSHGHTGSTSDPPWDSGTPDADANMLGYLYCGVTRVFDPGAHDEEIFERRADIESGELLGPHLYVAGPVFTAPGGHPVPMMEINIPSFVSWYFIPHLTREVATPEAAKASVEALLTSKPDFVKMAIDRIPAKAPRLEPKVAAAITKTANADGVRSVAHIGTTQDAIDAAEAGVAAWIHGVYKERLTDEAITRLKSFDIPMMPTLVVFDSYATLGRERRVETTLEGEMFSETYLRSYDQMPEDFELDPAMTEFVVMLKKQRKDSLDNVRRLHAAGVTIIAGSDAQAAVFHGPGLHRELRLLERAGLPRIEVLRSATLNPARFFAKSDDPPFGIVSEGKQADLILVEGNPLEDLRALENIRAVVLGGEPLVRNPLRNAAK